MRSDAVDALNSGYEEIRSALREISEDNHQLNVSLEAEGLLRKMGSLEFGILTEFWNSVLRMLRRVNEPSHSLQSPQLDLNNAIPLLRSLVDLLVSFRDRFSEFEDLGQQKSGSSDYKSGRKRTKSVRLTQFEGSAVNTSLPPAEMFRTFVFLPIIDGFVTRLEQRIEAYEPVVNLFGFLHKLTLLPHECLQRAASKLIEAYPKDLEPELQNELVQFASFISQKDFGTSSESACYEMQMFQVGLQTRNQGIVPK